MKNKHLVVWLIGFTLCLPPLFSQGKYGEVGYTWVVTDPRMNGLLIEKYTNDPDFEGGVQEDDQLMVTVDLSQKPYRLLRLEYIDETDAVAQLDTLIVSRAIPADVITELLERRYAWDDENISFKNYGSSRGPINIHQEKNYKETRDKFWWINRFFDLSIPRIFNMRIGEYGTFIELGDGDVGLPSTLSQVVNVGVATDVVKFLASIPMANHFAFGGNDLISGGFGLGLRFDSPKIGGSVVYRDSDWGLPGESDLMPEDKLVFNNWYFSGYFSRTMAVQRKSEFLTGLTGDEITLRVKAGPVINSLQYQIITSSKGTKTLDQTNILESSHILLRFELVSKQKLKIQDDYGNEKTIDINKLYGALQFTGNIKLRWSMNAYLAYTINDMWRVGLTMGYMSPIQFEYPCGQETISVEWKPGFILGPEFSLTF